MKVTYYLEVVSSWCHWGEPAWAELKRRFSGRAQFYWKLAQMPKEAFPVSRAQCEWFYRRSGSHVRSPYMLNAGWFDPATADYRVPNLVTEAARRMGIEDGRVRLALADAAMREGQKVGQWDVALAVGARAGGLDPRALRQLAESAEIAQVLQASTDEFFALQVTQRPTFLFENNIGDRALFSGIVRLEPLVAAMEALLADEASYASWKAHFGDPPAV